MFPPLVPAVAGTPYSRQITVAAAISNIALQGVSTVVVQGAGNALSARRYIVQGAVEMVQHALEQSSERDIVQLDDERRAAMVSNLLVVLCGDRDAQPVVNTGSLYS